jgi:hypothetical protein
MFKGNMSLLRFALEYREAERRAECECLAKEVATIPVSPQALARLSQLDPEGFQEVIRFHPGFEGHRKVRGLRTMLETFGGLYKDLSADIQRFNDYARQVPKRSRDKNRRAALEEISGSVGKHIFALAAAALALVQLSRRVRKYVSAEEFDSKLADNFDAGLREFIKDLRDNFSHEDYVEAHWAITYSGGGIEATFDFHASELLRSGTFNERSKQYIREHGDKIGVPAIFADYRNRVKSFYGWLNGEIEAHLPAEIVDYRRCVREHQTFMSRTSYRFFLNQWIASGVDPYQHLEKWLEPDELSEVYQLPIRSASQVARIIELVDDKGICNNELRELVFRLFQVEQRDSAVGQ